MGYLPSGASRKRTTLLPVQVLRRFASRRYENYHRLLGVSLPNKPPKISAEAADYLNR